MNFFLVFSLNLTHLVAAHTCTSFWRNYSGAPFIISLSPLPTFLRHRSMTSLSLTKKKKAGSDDDDLELPPHVPSRNLSSFRINIDPFFLILRPAVGSRRSIRSREPRF
ncbi:hypothetical protein BGW80DRAFT_901038 [Lactifluus volemus]|nr:hypothetical protein BGW80DRAFT_901038 [Lactifluus volemus]